MRALLAVIGVAGCGPKLTRAVPQAPAGDELTMYRDRTLVRQRIELDIPPAETTTIMVKVAIGVGLDDVVVLDRGELSISELRAVTPPESAVPAVDHTPDAADADGEAGESGSENDEPAVPPPVAAITPTELTFVVAGPHAGHYTLSLGYVTDRIIWDAAYTMTTTPARAQVTVRGAIAIRNTTGIAFAHARVFVIDSELGAWRGRLAEQFGAVLASTPASSTPLAPPRPLGMIALGTGETRVELLPGDPPRRLHSVLVYDPVGTRLDHGGSAPIRDTALGVIPAAASRVTESFEVMRPAASSSGLPGGPVRLLERRSDGSLAVLGETRLFEAATRVADKDTVAIGTAAGVTGKRERRELTLDEDGKRLVEEFVLSVANTRPTPVEVVIREHLYRGQNWTLAYRSALEADKEGPQQIAMRMTVPAHGTQKLLYVVVYTWEPATK